MLSRRLRVRDTLWQCFVSSGERARGCDGALKRRSQSVYRVHKTRREFAVALVLAARKRRVYCTCKILRAPGDARLRPL